MAGIKISALPPVPAAAFTDIFPTVQSGVTYQVSNTQLATLYGFSGGILSPAQGGTGVNNGTHTLTLAGSFTTSGAFAVTQTYTGATNVTFPTSGTLATTGQLPTPAALTKADDTNVTLTLTGTPATALLQAVTITAGWAGTLSGTRGGTGVNNGASTITIGGSVSYIGAFTFAGTLTGNTAVTFPTSGTLATTSQIPAFPLSLANGGTGAALVANNGGIFYSNASTGAILAGTATANQVLLSGSSAAPAWSSATYPATTTANQLLYSSATNTIGGLTSANNGTLVTSSAGVPSILAGPGTTGQILQSNAAAAPSFSTASYPSTTTINQILYSSSTNVVAGLATANSAVLVTGSTGIPVMSSTMTNGQIIIGSTGATPTAATITAGINISVTNAAGSITIATTGPGSFAWIDQTSGSVAMAVNKGYVTDNGASLVTYTLPATAVLGDTIAISGFSSGGWKIAQAASQLIHLGSTVTTTGTGGSLASTNAFDSIRLVCVVTNTTWVVQSLVGNLTVV